MDADTSAESLPSLAIHCHNAAGLAVANSQAAVAAGAVQVQGTINGSGERCGNVDLLTVIANLKLKLGYDCLIDGAGARLGELSDAVYEKAAVEPNDGQPYGGDNAFAHKGGMHVHAIRKHEAALKLPCGDPTMQKHPFFPVVGLTSPDHQLPVLERDRQIFFSKTCDR